MSSAIVPLHHSNSNRQTVGSAGAVFQSLGLRDSIAKKEKTVNIRIQEQSRKRQNMKELLVQNFLRRYMQKVDTASAANSALMSRIIANEVDLFMERERTGSALDQRALRQLEKDIERILNEDPRIGPQLVSPQRKGERSQQPVLNKYNVSSSQNELILPKINGGGKSGNLVGPISLTPIRDSIGADKNKNIKSVRNSA